MALTSNLIPGEKWKRFEQFGKELEPIVIQLNELLDKYKIHPIKDFISFNDYEDKITPFISYEAFPDSTDFQGASK